MTPVQGPDREEKLNQMVLTYEHDLRRVCTVYLGDADLAQDAVQETFIKAYRSMDGFRGSASEKTWLMRIAINTCKDMRRGGWFRHVDASISVDDLPMPVEPPSVAHIALMNAILALPPKYKAVVLLHCDQGMTVRETAAALKISAPAVINRLKKARIALRIALEGGADE